ncbi:unnamed protein product [Nippostrongylus brasiliensis]|uniref:Uncharacterized protein n=1 Tax=Nippostrongylus brasiliensis TaxID=27835 RepID=A0A0N4XP55_NIPBR|nr:unnamed protein product [Nippostrongylus brasiliensis]
MTATTSTQESDGVKNDRIRDLREGSSPLSGGHGSTMLSLAGVGGQHNTVSYVALHHNLPSAERFRIS